MKQLQARIRQLTADVNTKIAEVMSHGASDIFTKAVSRLKGATAYISPYTHEVRIPESREGYVGLGFKGKRKSELEYQLSELERFNEKEWESPAAMRRMTERSKKAYNTFRNRYGDLSYGEWENFVNSIDSIKDKLIGFGYENVGQSVAREYAQSKDKRKMLDIVREAADRNKGRGLTPEDFIDELVDELIEQGVADE